MQDIQVMLKSDAHHASIRSLKVLAFIAAVTHSWPLLVPWTSVVVPHLQSDQVSRLVKVHGIIISATAVKAKATKVCLQCRGCRNIISNIPLPPGLQGYALPRKCNSWVPDLNLMCKDFLHCSALNWTGDLTETRGFIHGRDLWQRGNNQRQTGTNSEEAGKAIG